MTRWIPVAAVAACLFAASAHADVIPSKDPPAKPRKLTAAEHKALEKKIVAAINTKAPAVDACVARYAAEYPLEKGSVTLALQVAREGKVKSVQATTKLRGARNLRPCLERAARGIAFPDPNTDKPVPLSLAVPVHKGAKFKVYAQGEAPKPEKREAPAPVTLQFTENSWMPRW